MDTRSTRREVASPASWTVIRLDEVVDVLDARRVPINASERERRKAAKGADELYPYYGATGQVDLIDDYLFDGEHILIGEDGAPFLERSRNKAYLVSGKFWVNNHAHILKVCDGVDSRFICHQLNAIDYHGFVSGTTRLKLTQAELNRIPLSVAPSNEQRRIADKVDELFSDIEEGERALERARKLLDRYRQTVLKAAVSGELTKEWRERHKGEIESGEALLSRILKARREAWEQAELAKMRAKGQEPEDYRWKAKHREPTALNTPDLPVIPDGWVWVTLGTLIQRGPQNGLYLPKSEYGDGIPIYRIDDFQPGWSRSSEELKRAALTPGDETTYHLEIGDIVLNRVNSPSHLGKVFVVERRHFPAVFESNMMRFKVLDLVEPDYIEIYLSSEFGRRLLTKDAKWAVNQASINQGDVASTPIPVPSRDEQIAITECVKNAVAEATSLHSDLERGVTASKALRQSILTAAFSGKLVPQDSSDEPASVLLDRIRAGRRTAGKAPVKRRGRQLGKDRKQAAQLEQPLA
jgi:type I restriction enzyme S subunit